MKATALLLLLIFSTLTACTAHIEVRDGNMECIVDSARRTALTCGSATVITGQVLINDETVQALGSTAADALLKYPQF